MQNEHIVLCGNYNLYMNTRLDKLDTMPEHHDNQNYLEDITSFLEINNLVDVWQTLHPDEKFFTWHRGNKRTRLDYIFCSDHLLNFIEDSSILPGIQWDHSLLNLSLISGNKQNRGKGFWKFNSSLLHDSVYVENIKNIQNVSSIYTDSVDKGAVWEFIKLEIRTYTIPYCIKKNEQKHAYERELNKKYEQLYIIINSDSVLNETMLEDFHETKSVLENLERERARGIILRSKSQWVEEGEKKNTAYFLRLEKQDYCNKLITKIKKEDKIVTNPVDILEEGKDFYMKLFSDNSRPGRINGQGICDENNFINNPTLPKLSDVQRTQCEGLMTENELLKSIKLKKKPPGTDGLTAEFYKFFWQDIKHVLLASINYALAYGKLSVEQRRGIISLLSFWTKTVCN